MKGGMWWAGQSQGPIDGIDNCSDIVEKIMVDAETVIRNRLSTMIADDLSVGAAAVE